MKTRTKIAYRFLRFLQKMPARQLMIALGVIIGFVVGVIAVVIKNLVHLIQSVLISGFSIDYSSYWYVIYPAVGIVATILFVKLKMSSGRITVVDMEQLVERDALNQPEPARVILQGPCSISQ